MVNKEKWSGILFYILCFLFICNIIWSSYNLWIYKDSYNILPLFVAVFGAWFTFVVGQSLSKGYS